MTRGVYPGQVAQHGPGVYDVAVCLTSLHWPVVAGVGLVFPSSFVFA